MSARRGFLNSLQFKLIVAFMSLVVAALSLSGGLFVFLSQGKEEQRALDHSVAAAPTINGGFLLRLLQGDSLPELESYVRDTAKASDVRILMLDTSGQVIVDTKDALAGEQLPLVFEGQDMPGFFRAGGRYEAWRLGKGSPASGLILVAPSPGQLPIEGGPRGQALALPYRLVVAVTESSIARAWLGLLPGLAIAAAIAFPVAVALAVVTARYITRPLNRLTAAAHQMAEGKFDVDLPAGRGDEVGQLTQAFSGMATRVGETYQQMRVLVANVSHDVRTPLSSIRGFAQALRSGVMQGETETRHAGEVIYEEAETLVSRLNDLIFLSELESGQAVLHREDMDLRTVVDGVLERLAAPTERKNGDVFLDVNQGITLSADRAKLERALENLLGNARKFTPPGGEVRVRAFVDEAGGNKVCIEVANSAPDVEAEELPHLFERFYRRDRAGSGKSSGTGLGLPIARDLIELHGGTLDASLRDGDLILTARLPRT
jgi:signal transduction histidine kinase